LSVFAAGSWAVVGWGIAAVVSPLPGRWRRTGPHVSRWARLGARCLGIRVTVEGNRPSPGALVVANHQGYPDIVAIGGLFPCVFAARHDMRSWPMLGALAASGATIFINRDAMRAGARGVAQVAAALGAGATVVAFPEGTSTDGTGLLPLRTGVFQAAVDAGAPVVPAAIRYLELDGAPIDDATRPVTGWYRAEPFVPHLLRLGSHRSTLASVTFGPPLEPPHADRRSLGAAAEAELRRLLGFGPEQHPRQVGRLAGRGRQAI
jgi:1-acyl-sn-glycerol-3-phosphate acyltransferase